jgi:hypothetical protein
MNQLRSLLLLTALVAAASSLSAQIGGGSIVGYVSDNSGGAVPGATVVARNLGTNAANDTKTNAQGYFEFPLLPPGNYAIEATATGFQKARSATFALSAGSRPRFDLMLSVGQQTESVMVTAAAPIVNATTTDTGVVIDRGKVENLPLNGRDFQQLVGLQAGVLSDPASALGARGGMEFNGSSALGNNLMLDGVDMSFGEANGTASDQSAGAGNAGTLINTVSVEAIEEFKASGSSLSAEYGRSTGGVLNVITKSGTNRYRGTLFHFLRNEKLDANSFFSNRSGLERPALRWNQFGGNLGGPIRRDKLFFFFNYEGAQVRSARQITGNTATPELLRQVKPSLRQVMEAYLPPVTNATSNPLLGFHRRNDSVVNDEHTYLSRVDAALADHRLSLRYSYNNQDYSSPTLWPKLRQVFPTRYHNAALQDTWVLRPNLINELRLGFNRLDLFRNEPGREAIPAFIVTAGGGPNVDLSSFIHYIPTTYTLANNLSWIRGRHTVKAGFEIRDLRANRGQDSQPRHMYDNIANLIADTPARVELIFGGPRGLRTRNHGFFVQDDWRISSRVQFNMGLRYEYTPPLRGGFNVSTRDPFGPFIGAQQYMYAPDRNNFAPRLGLVFDPFGNQKFIVRAGGGIGHLSLQPLFLFNLAFLDPALPFRSNFSPADVPAGVSSFPFPDSFVKQVAQNPALLPSSLVLARNIADHGLRDSYAGQWNLSLQYALTPNLALQAAYVASRSLKTTAPRTLNLVDPATRRRPRPEFGDVAYLENAGSTSYHSLQVSANQRLSRGLTFDVYYTWAKAMSYFGSDSTVVLTEGTVQDPNNLRDSYGPKLGDIGHRVTAVHSYELPTFGLRSGVARAVLGGWRFQGILGWRTGLPINITSGRDTAQNGRLAGQRPDAVAGTSQYAPSSTDPLLWLNRAAFDSNAAAAQRRFGNLGFNSARGPHAFTWDAGLHRTFSITEAQRLTFRLELFNALNHVVFSSPDSVLTSPNFGRILTGSEGRRIQLALKYQF